MTDLMVKRNSDFFFQMVIDIKQKRYIYCDEDEELVDIHKITNVRF